MLIAFGDLTLSGNAVLQLDTWIIGERHLYHGEGVGFDPEGLLSTLPAIVNVLIGYLAGFYIKQYGASYETIAKLMIAGSLLIFAGLAWDLVFPINKKLWTSSFVVYTCGIDLLVLSILLYILDVKEWKGWTYFFEVMGRNTLFIYLVSEFLAIVLIVFPMRKDSFYDRIYAYGFKSWANGYIASLLFAVSFMLLCWLVGYWMDKRRIYVKI